jgi:acyl-coenzyme A synthetase/AMP-(fatty) acid ligase
VYTSGSTGRPKGALQTHRNLLHCVYTGHNRLRPTEDDRMALLSPPTVGVSAAMLFGGLLIGAAVFPFDVRRQGLSSLVEWLPRERLTTSYSLPSVVRNMLRLLPAGQKLADLRTVKVGGEPFFRSDVLLYREHLPSDVRVQITLGTTETYAITWWHPNMGDDPTGPVLPVGKAEDHSEVFLVDDDGGIVGPGEVGEIMIRSRYLSPGYWQQPELTRAAYSEGTDGQRVYRSGDFGRWLPDGNLEHLGRKDFALKLSGHLVSPTEIETVLREVSSATEVVVVGHDGPDSHKRLVAYLVPPPGQVLDPGELRQRLSAALPPYMVPSRYVSVDRLPRLPNGKLDVRALGRPDDDDSGRVRPFVAPRSPFEEVLAAIWRDVLGVPAVGATDEFSELGGDSLQAAHVLARASAACGVDLPFDVLIEAHTVEALATTITERIAATLDPRELGELLDEVEATSGDSPLP